MKFRLVTNGRQYKVQYKTFIIWRDFGFGVNEGGGSYLILENTPEQCWDKLKQTLEGKLEDEWYSFEHIVKDKDRVLKGK